MKLQIILAKIQLVLKIENSCKSNYPNKSFKLPQITKYTIFLMIKFYKGHY